MSLHPSHDPNVKSSPIQRWVENGHIFLWLIKDTCWVNEWRAGGLTMIAPTLGVAIYILWHTRQVKSELFHNLAICLWICGNSIWMAGEFFHREMKHYVFLLFLAGLTCMLYYYCIVLPRERKMALVLIDKAQKEIQ